MSYEEKRPDVGKLFAQMAETCLRLWQERLEAEKRAQRAEDELEKLRAELAERAD